MQVKIIYLTLENRITVESGKRPLAAFVVEIETRNTIKIHNIPLFVFNVCNNNKFLFSIVFTRYITST